MRLTRNELLKREIKHLCFWVVFTCKECTDRCIMAVDVVQSLNGYNSLTFHVLVYIWKSVKHRRKENRLLYKVQPSPTNDLVFQMRRDTFRDNFSTLKRML